MEKFKQYYDKIDKALPINESANKSLSRIMYHFDKYDIGIITAFRKKNKDGIEFIRYENKKRNQQLRKNMANDGFISYVKVTGSYMEEHEGIPKQVIEESYLYIDFRKTGKLRNSLIKNGILFDQDSILFKAANQPPMLYGTNHTNDFIKYGEIKQLDNLMFNQPANVFTKLKGDRKFTFTKITEIPDSWYMDVKDNAIKQWLQKSKEKYGN